MGDEADWILDQLLLWDHYYDDGSNEPCGCRGCGGRRRHPPPKPETMSMFDDLDAPPAPKPRRSARTFSRKR